MNNRCCASKRHVPHLFEVHRAERECLMRRFILLAVAVIVMAGSKGTRAASDVPTSMPETVREFLNNLSGSWSPDGTVFFVV